MGLPAPPQVYEERHGRLMRAAPTPGRPPSDGPARPDTLPMPDDDDGSPAAGMPPLAMLGGHAPLEACLDGWPPYPPFRSNATGDPNQPNRTRGGGMSRQGGRGLL